MAYWKHRKGPSELAQESQKEPLIRLAYNKPALALKSLSDPITTTEGNGVYLRQWHKHEVVIAAVNSYIRKGHFSTALRELGRHAHLINPDAKRSVVTKVSACVEGFNSASLALGMLEAIGMLSEFLDQSRQSEFRIRIQTRARIMGASRSKKQTQR